MPTYLYYVALAFGMVAQCLAAPAGSPHEHTAQNPSPNARQPQPVNHLQNGQHSGHHNLQQPASTATTSQLSFVDALDTFLSAYKAHPDLDALVPLPSQVGRLAGQYEQQFGHTTKTSPPSQFEHDLDAFLHLYKTNHHDLDSLVPLPIHGHAALPPASDQQPVHPSSSHQLLSDSQHSSDLYPRSSSEAHGTPLSGTPQPYTIYLPPLGSSHAAEASANTKQMNRESQTKRRRSSRQDLLGRDASAVTQRFADFHNIDFVQARMLLNSRLKEKEIAELLKNPNPEQFEKGAKMLPRFPQHGNRGSLTKEVQQFFRQQRGKMHALRDNESRGSTAVIGTASGEKRTRITTGADEEESSSTKELKGTSAQVPNRKAEHDKMWQQAETILSPKIIRAMARVYRNHTSKWSVPSHKHVRKAITSDPRGAPRLAIDLLSGKEPQIKAALVKIGPPQDPSKSQVLETNLPLPTALANKVLKYVAQHRKVSRIRASQIVSNNLTPDIVKGLQEPLLYHAAMEKLLFQRPYASRPAGQAKNTWH
jgi:hypothetical protein